MLDLKTLRHNLEEIAKRLLSRGYKFDIDLFTQLESQRKTLQVIVQTLKERMNLLAKEIAVCKIELSKASSHEAQFKVKNRESPLMEESKTIKQRLLHTESELQEVQSKLESFLLKIPNLPHHSVPLGRSSEENRVVRSWGTPRTFDFAPKEHPDLLNPFGDCAGTPAMDFENAVKIAGGRFVVLHGQLARLHRALIQFMLDVHTKEHGYEEVYVPYLANYHSLQGTGQLPGFTEDLFTLKSPENFYLIPTAEVSVTNLARDVIFNPEDLPKKYVCHSPCFRREAGSYGKDVRGMIRQHQFEKVELVRLCTPDTAEQGLEELTRHAETILQRLELPYQVVSLCTGDLGFSSQKTYDLEVWLPGQAAFREISSCSHFGDFQARRLKARWRRPEQQQTEWIHTLNGSGLAVGRTLIAILENYQDAQGRVQIPTVLKAYLS